MKNNKKNTKQFIIEVASKLFVEKGFDKISMQDLVRESGMSKGAMYHYFKSKEEIFQAVLEIQNNMIKEQTDMLVNCSTETDARTKFMNMLRYSIEMQQKDATIDSVTGVLRSPEFFLKYMQDNIKINAPVFANVIEEGNKDGSFKTIYSNEVSEVFLLLLNIWCDPMVFEMDKQKYRRKLLFIQEMMKLMGVDVLSDDMIDKMIN